MRRLAALLVAAALGGPAAAEPWACAFTAECVAGAGCETRAFDVEILPADHAGDLFLTSITGDSPLERLTDKGALPATYASAGADGLAELMTIEADMTALLTVHIFDVAAQAATYFGTCEELR